MKINRLTFAVLFLFLGDVHAVDKEYYEAVAAFKKAVKTEDPRIMAGHINYPLGMRYPVQAIKDSCDFIKRYADVFDNNITKLVIESDISRDWERVGWRGIMLKNGILWLDENGRLSAINYETKLAKDLRQQIIEKDRKTLYPSIREYLEPVFEWKTKKYLVRVDKIAFDKYRYVSWPSTSGHADKPELVLENGTIKNEGSGGNHIYTFSSSIYKYVVDIPMIVGEKNEIGTLSVYKKDKLILNQEFIEIVPCSGL